MRLQDEILLNLSQFRENLKILMKPEVLQKLAEFLEETADQEHSMLEKYKWFVENSQDGLDCKYASAAKEFFLENQAEQAAKAVIWLYENWAKAYK